MLPLHDVLEPANLSCRLLALQRNDLRNFCFIWTGSKERESFGGAGRDRTDDLKLAKLPLSQLSYGPILCLWPAGQTRNRSRRAFALAALRADRKRLRDRQTMPKASQGRMAAAHVCAKAERRMSHKMVGLGGLEPPTSRLSSARSNQLSYKPELSRAAHDKSPRAFARERCSWHSSIKKKEKRRRRRPAFRV